MRAMDPRLLRRTQAARPLLAIDTLLGIATALAVLAQASLLSLIVAKAFEGAPPRGLGTEFALLVAAFALRAAFAWGMEVSGRRAAKEPTWSASASRRSRVG
jgi:ATP-binding cassette, subfamily C, bacterial CydD